MVKARHGESLDFPQLFSIMLGLESQVVLVVRACMIDDIFMI